MPDTATTLPNHTLSPTSCPNWYPNPLAGPSNPLNPLSPTLTHVQTITAKAPSRAPAPNPSYDTAPLTVMGAAPPGQYGAPIVPRCEGDTFINFGALTSHVRAFWWPPVASHSDRLSLSLCSHQHSILVWKMPPEGTSPVVILYRELSRSMTPTRCCNGRWQPRTLIKINKEYPKLVQDICELTCLKIIPI